jgi:SMC interacting uncharacterized protein involved in chromosome segregation
MGWFCDKYSRVKTENEQLKAELNNLQVELELARERAEIRDHDVDIYTERLETELETLRLQAKLYDQIMKGLRINVNLAGKKK